MALARGRRTDRRIDYWPGFVDALSTLLLAIMFLLGREISGKDTALSRLNSQINELTQLLALERSTAQDKEDSLANLQASLSAAQAEKSRLEQLLAQGAG
ncbi:MAG: peptidoglycan-binding protein, partial [Mesorhizobium sp.]